MDFFEEDDQTNPPTRQRATREHAVPDDSQESGARPRMSSSRRRNQGRLRLVAAAAVGVLILVLLINSYLDSRARRGYEDYVRDLSSLTAETEQLSESFFSALGGASDGDLPAQGDIGTTRGTAQGLTTRADNLDAPDDLKDAQSQIVLAYILREEAIETVSEQLPDALGKVGAKRATREIAAQMKVLSASDVLFARARRQIEAELADREIFVEGDVPQSAFIPDDKNSPEYLTEDGLSAVIAGAGGAGGSSEPAADGLRHGLALDSVTIDGVALSADEVNTLSATSAEVEVAVENQGEDGADESNVPVTLSGGDFEGMQKIPTITAGEIATTALPLTPVPSPGDTATLTVEVATVDGEQIADNNTATYELAFE